MFKKPLEKSIQVGKLTVSLPHLSLITKEQYSGKDVQLQERGRKHIVCPVGKKGHSADLHVFWPHFLQLLNTLMRMVNIPMLLKVISMRTELNYTTK